MERLLGDLGVSWVTQESRRRGLSGSGEKANILAVKSDEHVQFGGMIVLEEARP